MAISERIHWFLAYDYEFDMYTDYNNMFLLFDSTFVNADLSEATLRKFLR